MHPTPPAAFGQLVEFLTFVAADDTVVGDLYESLVVNALLSTPYIDPLDDYTYEMLLEFSGLPLDDAQSLDFAAAITSFLLGTNQFHLACSHGDSPSPLCTRLVSTVDIDDLERGFDAAEDGLIDEALAVRAVRERRYDRDRQSSEQGEAS